MRLTRTIVAASLLLGACQAAPDRRVAEVTQIASLTARHASPAVAADVEIRGTDPAIVRLYHVPAAYTAAARSDIAAARSGVGRWAAGSRAAQRVAGATGWTNVRLRAALPIAKGDLIILALEPVGAAGGGRFDWRATTFNMGEQK